MAHQITSRPAAAVAVLALAVSIAGCSDADVASRNISRAADQFEIVRRIIFYNGVTGGYILTVEGLCSIGNEDRRAASPSPARRGRAPIRSTISACPTT